MVLEMVSELVLQVSARQGQVLVNLKHQVSVQLGCFPLVLEMVSELVLRVSARQGQVLVLVLVEIQHLDKRLEKQLDLT